MKRFIVTLIILVLIVAGGYQLFSYVSESADSKATGIRTDTAKLRDLESVVSATGEVLPLI